LPKNWPQISIVPIWALQIARIMGVSHLHLAGSSLKYYKLHDYMVIALTKFWEKCCISNKKWQFKF
jgi:hypothetical protein